MQVRGKTAVITGGASGIGLATANALAAEGSRLVLADIHDDDLRAAAEQLGAVTEVLAVRTDVSDRASVFELAERAVDAFGGVDVVFLNAGVGATGPLIDATYEDWQWLLGVNLWGPIHGVQAFVPMMLERGAPGHVIFTSSFAGLVANAGLGPYSASKAAVVSIAETLHRELRGTPLSVSVMCPMMVRTNVDSSHRNRPAALGGPQAGRDFDFGDDDMAGRIVDPDAVARLIVEAIETPRLYLFTHPESRAMIARRFQHIDAAFEHE
jgi:NAD(P)-dependent dehydrogenase (short-subunit alcohol dehydrogenase family)